MKPKTVSPTGETQNLFGATVADFITNVKPFLLVIIY